MGAEDGPSCSEEEKDAVCQRSASTTLRSTMGTLPYVMAYEKDKVMGVASAGSHESVRFGEGNDPETEDTPHTVAHNREAVNQNDEGEVDQRDVTPGVGEFHGGFGSASFRECLNIAALSTNNPSASCRSEGNMRESVTCRLLCIQLTPSLLTKMHCTAAWAQVATRKECLSSIVGPCRNNSSTLSSLVLVQEVWPLRLCGNEYWSATA